MLMGRMSNALFQATAPAVTNLRLGENRLAAASRHRAAMMTQTYNALALSYNVG